MDQAGLPILRFQARKIGANEDESEVLPAPVADPGFGASCYKRLVGLSFFYGLRRFSIS